MKQYEYWTKSENQPILGKYFIKNDKSVLIYNNWKYHMKIWVLEHFMQTFAADNYLFKANNKDTRTASLLSLVLTLNIIYILLCYFHCWLWTSKRHTHLISCFSQTPLSIWDPIQFPTTKALFINGGCKLLVILLFIIADEAYLCKSKEELLLWLITSSLMKVLSFN